jgi:hypothetical protein
VGGKEGALRLSSFPLCARWNGGRKVFENKRRARGKTSERAAVSKEKDADLRPWRRMAEHSGGQDRARAESSWEDRWAQGEILREVNTRRGTTPTAV